jgi:hypothetical protein
VCVFPLKAFTERLDGEDDGKHSPPDDKGETQA